MIYKRLNNEKLAEMRQEWRAPNDYLTMTQKGGYLFHLPAENIVKDIMKFV